mmetsp:Transcript_11683/g.27992  ORF Transcript_11683/g.27992 Transcript_11683/m.27992 type:complete len:577 (-) Transcript_11683:47-1777(-)
MTESNQPHHRRQRRIIHSITTSSTRNTKKKFLSFLIIMTGLASSSSSSSRTTTTAHAATASTMSSPSSPSAIVHAVGGSVGSALALLLFYPLERSRIELQARVASSSASSAAPVADSDHDSSSSASSSLALSRPNSDDVDVVIENDHTIGDDSCVDGGDDGDDDDDDRVVTTRSRSGSGNSSSSEASWSMQSRSDAEEGFHQVQMEPVSTAASTPTNQPSLTRLHQKKMSIFNLISNYASSTTNEKNGIVRCILDLASRGELYKGLTPIITTTFISQFIFFFMNAYIKRFIFEEYSGTTDRNRIRLAAASASSKALLSLTASCLAGIGNVLLTNPLWVTNMAIVKGKTKTQNLFDELIHLIRTRGWKHLWDGTGASILLVSNPIIQFFCYEQIKQLRLNQLEQTMRFQPTSLMGGLPKVEIRGVETFLIAALAKGIATVLTYPLQLTQTLLRLGDDDDDDDDESDTKNDGATTVIKKEKQQQHHPRYKGTCDCLYQLYQTKGISSWFTGMRAKMIQTVFTAAFTFLTYEQILSVVQTVMMRNNINNNNNNKLIITQERRKSSNRPIQHHGRQEDNW